jgi:malate permease and related proteins
MMTQAVDIFTLVLLPVLLVVGLGALVQKTLTLDVNSLSKLNIYLLVPALLLVQIYESSLNWGQIAGISAAVLLPMLILGVPLYVMLRRRRAAGTTTAAVLIGGLVMNAGNFGLPVAELTYRTYGLFFPGMQRAEDGMAVQVLVVMMSSLAIWCLGYAALALAKGDGLRGAAGYFKLPILYVIAAGFLLRDTGVRVPPAILEPLRMVGDAAIPVMLIILGAQLAQRARWPRWRIIGPVMAVKLAIVPAVTAAVCWAMGLWPWPAAQIVLGMAAPTAVNTLLLTLELDGDAGLAADCVFWTTIASAVSITVILMLLTPLAV